MQSQRNADAAFAFVERLALAIAAFRRAFLSPQGVSSPHLGAREALLLSHGVLLLTPAHCHLALLGLLRTRRSGDVPLQLAQHVRRLKPGRVHSAWPRSARPSGSPPPFRLPSSAARAACPSSQAWPRSATRSLSQPPLRDTVRLYRMTPLRDRKCPKLSRLQKGHLVEKRRHFFCLLLTKCKNSQSPFW